LDILTDCKWNIHGETMKDRQTYMKEVCRHYDCSCRCSKLCELSWQGCPGTAVLSTANICSLFFSPRLRTDRTNMGTKWSVWWACYCKALPTVEASRPLLCTFCTLSVIKGLMLPSLLSSSLLLSQSCRSPQFSVPTLLIPTSFPMHRSGKCCLCWPALLMFQTSCPTARRSWSQCQLCLPQLAMRNASNRNETWRLNRVRLFHAAKY
jgi:hypothetical protein